MTPFQRSLTGEFVNLRALQGKDAELTFSWRQAHRARFLNAGATTVEAQAAWIFSRPSNEFNFIIELKNNHEVGMLSLIDVDMANLRAEPARFLIGDEAATRGVPVAAEAMKLLYSLAFDELGLVRVWGIVAANNSLTVKWQKYMGMKEEGRLRNHLRQGTSLYDAIYLGLLVEEYRKTTLPRLNGLISAARRGP